LKKRSKTLLPFYAWTLALRDLKGLRGIRIVLACLALGVAAIAAVGSLQAAINTGLATQGRTLLGGDIAIDNGAEPLPDTLRSWLQARGAKISAITLLRTLVVAPGGDRILVELKAVDAAYPLLGAPTLEPAMKLATALNGGIAADPLVLERLHRKPGDSVRIGDATLRLNAALIAEPDHAEGFAILGPRVLIAAAGLPATGLIQPGSLVTHDWRVLLPTPGPAARATIDAMRKAFPGTGWRIRDASQANEGADQAVRQTGLFLVLVGLSALLIGGIGVATGVRAWLEGRAGTIATLRCLGASSRLVFAVFLIQVMLLCTAGIAIGVAAGALLPIAIIDVFGASLPVPAQAGIYPGPLALAALYGLLTALTFSLWPLGRAARIPGAALFRDATLPAGTGSRRMLALNAGLALLLGATIIATAADRGFAAWFCISALATLGVFRAGAWALMHAARRFAAAARSPRPAWLSLGLANLHRPGSATPLLLVALGLGLATLAAVALIEGNINSQFIGAVPRDAPSFFFLDIQNDQLAPFRKIVDSLPGTADVRIVPSLRARIVSLNGVPAERAHIAAGAQWALRGDRGLTYAATVPKGSRITTGSWWPANYDGAPLLSLDEGLAKGWGLKVGDTLRANVLGRDIDFRIANLRMIDWRALGINFTLLASPGLLEHAPHMNIATLRDPPGEDAALLARVTDALPNVTGIRVADVLAAVATLVDKLAAALAAACGVTLIAGALVLAGAVAAGQRRRTAEAVILKTLGATRAQIRAAWLVEFGLIGATAGLIAAALGTLASWAMSRFVMQIPWLFLPGTLAATVAGCVLLMLVFGYAGTAAALRVRPARLLRNE
jgi:putative ABC transport system permease protein